MKRLIFSVLAALMLLPVLTACSETPTADTATQAPQESTAPAPTQVSDFQEILLVDSADCTFKITAAGDDSIWGYTLQAFLENKTDAELMFSLDDVSVNGYMCDPFWASTVAPGMKANEEISFSDSDFEKNGITEVSEITFTLTVYDANDWSADHLVEETFTVHP